MLTCSLCTQLLSHFKSCYWLHLSNIAKQTCCPLCEHNKLNKLDDDSKKFLKKGNMDWRWKNYGNNCKFEIKKFGNESENGNKLNIELKVNYKILRHLLSLFWLVLHSQTIYCDQKQKWSGTTSLEFLCWTQWMLIGDD